MFQPLGGYRLVWAGVGHYLEPRLVDDVQEVLGINGKSVSCRQHLLLVVLLQTEKHKDELWSAKLRSEICWSNPNLLFTYLVITYCWANFIFPISSARSEFNSFCAISICTRQMKTNGLSGEEEVKTCQVCLTVTSLCVLAGSWGRVSSTVANNVLRARPTSWNKTHTSGYKQQTWVVKLILKQTGDISYFCCGQKKVRLRMAENATYLAVGLQSPASFYLLLVHYYYYYYYHFISKAL